MPSTRRIRHHLTPSPPSFSPLYSHGVPSGTSQSSHLLFPSASITLLQPPNAPVELFPTAPTDLASPPISVALSPDATLALRSLRSGQVDLINIETRSILKSLRPFRDTTVVSHLSFHPVSALALAGSTDGLIHLYNVPSMTLTHSFTLGPSLLSLAFHPDPESLVLLAGKDNGKVVELDLGERTGAGRTWHERHVGGVRGMAFCAGGEWMVSVGGDGLVGVAKWEKGRAKEVRMVAMGESMVDVIGDEHGVWMVGEKGELKYWDVKKGNLVGNGLKVPFVREEIGVSGMQWCGEKLVIALGDQTLIWLSVSKTGDAKVVDMQCGNLDEIYDVCVLNKDDDKDSANSDLEVAVCGNSEIVWIICRRASSTGWVVKQGLVGHSSTVLCLSHTHAHDIDYLLSGSRDGTCIIWTRGVGAPWTRLCALRGHTGVVGGGCIWTTSSGGVHAASGGADCTLKQWTVGGSPREQWTRLGHDKEINVVTVSAKGVLLGSGGGDKTVRIWHAATGEVACICRGHRRGVWDVGFSRVDKVVVSASADGSVRVWDAHSGACLRTYDADVAVVACAFAWDGRTVLAGAADGTLRVWNAADAKPLGSYPAHDGRVWGLHAGRFGALTAGEDGQVRAWTDDTRAVEREEREREAGQMREMASVDECERQGRWAQAVSHALSCGMKRRTRDLLRKALAQTDLSPVVAHLAGDEHSVATLVTWCKEWAAGGRDAGLLAAVVVNHLALHAQPAALARIDGGHALAAIAAHVGRQIRRVDGELADMAVVEWMLERADGVQRTAPEAAAKRLRVE